MPLFFERFFKGRYQFVDGHDPRQKQGIDVDISSESGNQTMDYKILNWPHEKIYDEGIEKWVPRKWRYTAISAETKSNIIDGRDRDGWMKTGTARWLFWCFLVPVSEVAIEGYLIDFPSLQKWFWSMPLDTWPQVPVKNENKNTSLVSVVPIREIVEAGISVRKYTLWPLGLPVEHFCEECGYPCGNGRNVDTRNGKHGLWYCAEHQPPNPYLAHKM